MRRFFIILSLIIFTTCSFGDCSPGTYEGTLILPTTSGTASGDYSEYTITFSDGETLTLQGTCSKIQGSAASGYMSESRPTRSSSSDSNVNCWCKIQSYGGYNLTAKWIFVDGGLTYCSVVCAEACAAAYDDPNEWEWHFSWDNPSISTQGSFRNLYQSSLINPPTVCKSCSDKPANTEWTTGCNYQCSAGRYGTSVTSTVPVTFPTTAPDSTTNSGTEWSATWSNDTASGTSGCSSSKSSYNTSTGKHCWCKLTAWNSTSLTASWIYLKTMLSSSVCSSSCASYCADEMSDSTFRSDLFNSVTNTPTVTITSTECIACPSGGTSSAGSTAITQCYVPTTTEFTDAAGTYHYSSNCYYSE